MTSIRIVIVDDHALVRAGVRRLMEEVHGAEVVGEASNGEEALAIVEFHHPDLVLMDIAMPGINGLEATALIKGRFPDVRMIMLSIHSSEEEVLQALRAGASGYLLKTSAPTEMGVAVESVMSGGLYLSPGVSQRFTEGYLDQVDIGIQSPDFLSPRQLELLNLVKAGCSTDRQLGVSIKTMETYRAQLIASLDVHEIAGLIRYAIQSGHIHPRDR